MPDRPEKSFSVKAREWARKNDLHGPQAYLRYVFFNFLDCLAQGEDEFIFKGGNLLWLYIKTPRQTIDLDLVTRSAKTLAKVTALLKRACARGEGIRFEIESISEVGEGEGKGASVTIRFRAEDGATNTFDLDVVYVVPTDSALIPSPLPTEGKIRAATVENILVDKIATCHRFGGGNTRMKDFDDLWRLSQSGVKVGKAEVRKRLAENGVAMGLDTKWLNAETEGAWKRHSRRYEGLPAELATVFGEINAWLGWKR